MLIYFAMLAIAGLFILRRPGVAAGVLFCTYGLEQWVQSQSAWFFMHGTVTNVATASLMLLAVVVQLQRGRAILQGLGREFWLAMTLTGYAVASTAWSVSPGDSIAQFRSEGLYFGVFVFLMPLVVLDRNDLRDACLAILCLGTVIGLLLLTTSRWDQRSIVFQSGTALILKGIDRGNPLSIGSFGGYLALVALMINFTGKARFVQVLRYAVFCIGFAVTIRSGSRGQAAGIILAALVLLPYSRRFKDLGGFLVFGFSAVVFLILALVIFDKFIDAGDARWTLDSSVDSMRGARFGMAGFMLGEWVAGGPFRWIFGLGSSSSWALLGFYPHVVPAEVLAELGVFGFAIFCAMVFKGFQSVREIRPLVRDDPQTRGLVACIASIALFEFIVCFKEGSLVSSNELLGAIAVVGRITLNLRQEAAANAEIEAAGYAMTDEERLLEDDGYLDELYEPVPAGSRG